LLIFEEGIMNNGQLLSGTYRCGKGKKIIGCFKENWRN